MGETSRLSCDVEVAGDNPSIGIAVHVGETFTVGYYLLIDFGRRRIEFKSGVRMTEQGGQMFPYEVELERPGYSREALAEFLYEAAADQQMYSRKMPIFYREG